MLKAIELGPNDNTVGKILETYKFLVYKVILRNESRLQDALDLCETALTTYPGYAHLYALKGNVLLRMNRAQEALPILEMAANAGLSVTDAHYGLGLAHKKLGNKAKAEASFRNVLMVEPGHEDAILQLGMLLLSTGNLREAERL